MQLLSEENLQTLFKQIPENEKPQKLYFKGKPELLERRKIAIVGARRANKYTKTQTYMLAHKLAEVGFAVVSGAAEGVDAFAHDGAYPSTIAVMPCGLDSYYPQSNKSLIQKIYDNSLAVSEYDEGEMPRNYTFVHRNRLVVGMSEAVIITEADLKSGSMRSAEYALKYNIPLYVLAQRIDESLGTNTLLKEGRAKPIFDIDSFVRSLGVAIKPKEEIRGTFGFTEFFAKYGDKVYEMELEGKIEIKNGSVKFL